MLLFEAEQLAKQLLTQYELEDWTFRFDNAKRRFGQCNYTRKTISLSKHLVALNARDEVEETIRHEIAHALAGPHARHGREWVLKCIMVGAKPERCYDGNTVSTPQHNYEGRCPTCGRLVATRIRLKGAAHGLACSRCCRADGGYNPKHRLVWTKVDRTDHSDVEFVDELPGR